MSAPREASLREADARARARAQSEFAVPLAIEAGAGTGKTAVLVARVVAWCIGPGWERAERRLREVRRAAPTAPTPDEVAREALRGVVAITFTEAAAAEMEGRVASALRVAAAGALAQGSDPQALPPDAGLRAERARALAANRDQLSVRTIHAFCRRILAAHPLEAGLHPRFEVDAQQRLQAAVAREVLEARLREAFGDPGAPDFLELADEELGPADVERALSELLLSGAPATLLDADPLAADRIRAFADALRGAVRRFFAAGGEALARVPGAARVRSAAEAVLATRAFLDAVVPEDVAGFDAWSDAFRKVWAPGDVSKLADFAAGDFGARGARALGSDAAAGEVAAQATALHGLVKHAIALRPRRLARLRAVLGPLLHEAHARLRRRGVVGFAAILRETEALLARHEAVAAAVRGEIDQLLVDEFQDTDAVQCEILAALAFAGPPGARPGLFLVGDPKQSIYGWRNADLAAYEAFLARVRDAGGSVERLTVNFRSVPAVLDEVASVVAPSMRARAGLQPRFEALLPCPELAEDPGFREGGRLPVEHWISWGFDAAGPRALPALSARRAAELEARALARDLRELHDRHGVAFDQIALLFRSTADFEVYLAALREVQVPFVVERDTTFYERREIQDALAWVCCVLDPHDQLSLVAALRSSAVGVPDGALVPLWRREFPALVARIGPDDADAAALACLRGVVVEAAGALPEALPGIERVRGWEASLVAFVGAVAELRATFERDSAAVFVERLRTRLLVDAGEAARHLGGWRLANLDRFFRGFAESLEETGGDRAAVLAHLRRAVTDEREHEEGRPRAAAEDAVHLTTIHKAKGLAFDHVYLLQLHKGGGRDDPKQTRAVPEAGGRPAEYRLCGVESLGHREAAERRAEVERHERVRLLYVALTRARKRLVLVGKLPRAPGTSPRTLADLWALRSPPPPGLETLMLELAAAGRHSLVSDARWHFPTLLGAPEPLAARVRGERAADLSQIAFGETQLARLRAAAAARSARPFHAAASQELLDTEAALEARYGTDGARGGRGSGGRERGIALAAGTAVHAALEHFDAAAAPERQLEAFRERVRSALVLTGIAEREAAESRAQDVLERARASGMLERLARIAPTVVARELPVLLAPDADEVGPVGFWSGVIDLLYWDPGRGELVVVDYKTDRVTREEARLRAGAYAQQGAVYTRAVEQALGLGRSPRFELWFLAAGEVVPVPSATRPALP